MAGEAFQFESGVEWDKQPIRRWRCSAAAIVPSHAVQHFADSLASNFPFVK